MILIWKITVKTVMCLYPSDLGGYTHKKIKAKVNINAHNYVLSLN